MLEEKRLLSALQYLHTTDELSKELHVSGRELRRAIKRYNDDYDLHEVLIVSNKDGYFLSTNEKDIRKYALNRINHALSELKNGRDVLKELAKKDQLSIFGYVETFDQGMNLIDQVMKFYER